MPGTAASPKSRRTVAGWASELRRALREGGSSERAKGIEWFFKEPVRAHGWRTADVRRLSRAAQREILRELGPGALFDVADALFGGQFNEEKNAGVFLLENRITHLGDAEFRRFEGWLPRITNWSDHDALVYYLIAPLVLADPKRASRLPVWARSRNRWHRRAAAVALIRLARARRERPTIIRISNMLLAEEDDIVQKGLGWLLREWAKADPKPAVKYLMTIRGRTSRLVLRTACEKLTEAEKRRVLAIKSKPMTSVVK
jgi:3-methyladenine DNA glycosylase AlkD